jgi:hypothetical protein
LLGLIRCRDRRTVNPQVPGRAEVGEPVPRERGSMVHSKPQFNQCLGMTFMIAVCQGSDSVRKTMYALSAEIEIRIEHPIRTIGKSPARIRRRTVRVDTARKVAASATEMSCEVTDLGLGIVVQPVAHMRRNETNPHHDAGFYGEKLAALDCEWPCKSRGTNALRAFCGIQLCAAVHCYAEHATGVRGFVSNSQ